MWIMSEIRSRGSGLKEAERVSKDMSVKKAWELLSSKREST